MSEINTPHQEQEFLPEQIERIKFLVQNFEQGLDSPDIIGYHGASLEVIKDIVKSGKLKGVVSFSPKMKVQERTLSIYKKDAEFSDKTFVKHHGKDEALNQVVTYATTISLRHQVLQAAGLPLDDKHYLDVINDEELQMEMVKNGLINKNILHEILTRYFNTSGVVIGIHKDALADFTYYEGNLVDEENEIQFLCPEGIDIKYIVGIEPESEREWNYFENLQNRFS